MSDPAAKTIPAATPVNASASDKGPASETLTPTVQLAKLAFEKLSESGVDALSKGLDAYNKGG